MSVSINDQNDQISTTIGVLRDTDTGGFVVPLGTTNGSTGRPTIVGNNGLIRYNTDTNSLEAVISGAYQTIATIGSISGFLLTSGGNQMIGNLGLAVGTASSPSLYFVNTADTAGLFSPSANVICVSTTGTEVARFDNLGNVGIGKSPSVRLDVTNASATSIVAALSSTGSSSLLSLSGNGNTTPVIVGTYGNSFAVTTNAASSPQFIVDTNGYAYAITPPALDSTTKLATTAWTTAYVLNAFASQSIINVQIFQTSGIYTPTVGMIKCIVQMVGGGAGGASSPSGGGSASGGSGGGSGAELEALLTAAQVGASQVITIGSHGTGGAPGSNPGTDGGTTSFGSLLSCTGGIHGTPDPTPGSNGGSPGGVGGNPTISVGTEIFRSTGQSGGCGGGNFMCIGGAGGSNRLGEGGAATCGGINVNGNSGTGYGSGGSGAVNGIGSVSGQSGGNGSSGYVVVIEFMG